MKVRGWHAVTGEGLPFVLEILKQVQDDMVNPTNVQCVVLPLAVQDDIKPHAPLTSLTLKSS